MPAKATARFDARMSAEQKALLERAAELSGSKSVADFVLSSAVKQANQIVQTETLLQLSQQEAMLFAKALYKPAKPTKALKQLKKDYEAQLNVSA